jgi:hypothetical protein
VKNDRPEPPSDADVEREIRQRRTFTVSEAIGRMAGPGAMKGASAVAPTDQAKAEIHGYLRRHLSDSGGPLETALFRHVIGSDRFLDDHDRPLVILAGCIQRILDSEFMLRDLVREADTEWGRIHGERPHFEKEGSPPQADDPYTLESVRNALTRLRMKLTDDVG